MKHIVASILISCSFFTYCQNENIVKTIDDLTAKWDKQAEELGTYAGMKYYCTSQVYKDKTIGLLDKIHHYDTLLYQIVSEKYADSNDKEAEETLAEILTVETKYTTPNFKSFLEEECLKFEEVGEDYDRNSKKYFKEIEKLEKELSSYVKNITERIDLIDEHIHHLKLD
ncbi:hypothetical protein SAMN05421640_1085 [Ekhidna lutea]|uniref:Uncharacterized protein n=1 Tax=Ekhidna lutea TaxID=447679 RepID=A0A239H030_EKHLU|nr:hypothetical protein [Ekhidna lutea]SNS74737.1 hypothetical protein SAMN05421640_1085 [Ekhidna lutea]